MEKKLYFLKELVFLCCRECFILQVFIIFFPFNGLISTWFVGMPLEFCSGYYHIIKVIYALLTTNSYALSFVLLFLVYLICMITQWGLPSNRWLQNSIFVKGDSCASTLSVNMEGGLVVLRAILSIPCKELLMLYYWGFMVALRCRKKVMSMSRWVKNIMPML